MLPDSLLPPAVTDGKLHAGVYARIFVTKTRAGNMHRVRADVNGTSRADEIVGSNAELWREVPDAGVRAGAIVVEIELPRRRPDGNGSRGRKRLTEGGVLMVRPYQTSSTLNPWHPALTVREIPAEDSRCDADPSERSAYCVFGRARDVGSGRHTWRKDLRALRAQKLRRVALPERKDLD